MARLICCIPLLMLGLNACQDETIGHIEATRIVILEKIPMAGDRFTGDFKSVLELTYPYACHDTVFIQDQAFLERIDLKPLVQHEFAIPPSLMRDFFGSNNPAKKRALREDLLFFGDTCFEKRPGASFLRDTITSPEERGAAISEYLSGKRNNSLVYFLGKDTSVQQYIAGGMTRPFFVDHARLNCRIVSDLRVMTKEEQLRATVVIILIPEDKDTLDVTPHRKVKAARKPVNKFKPETRSPQKPSAARSAEPPCPPDTTLARLNRHYTRIVTEFRNLLYYIATTRDDAVLRKKYREDAYTEIHRIPDVLIEGIPGGDLPGFLQSGFSGSVGVATLKDRCGLINGIRISSP